MSLVLNDVDYGPVQGASGVQGFFGEGYWFHHLTRLLGGSFRGMTFVAKTTTCEPRRGNMALKRTHVPRRFFPDCVVVNSAKGVVLNSVGLSGPGAVALFDDGRWQAREAPFLLSFMPVGKQHEERQREAEWFSFLLWSELPEFAAPTALQVNLSCANSGNDPAEVSSHAADLLRAMQGLRHRKNGVALVPKVNLLYPIEAAVDLQDLCDGLCVSNALPWGAELPGVDWRRLFGPGPSPLARYGGGALSGRPLLPLVCDWVRRARLAGFEKPINAGGGILAPGDVDALADAGADSVFVGSVAILKPWRVQRIIRRAHERLGSL